MAMPERSIVVGVFAERGEADRAIEELQGAGFLNEQIRFEQQEATPGRIAMPGGTAGGRAGWLWHYGWRTGSDNHVG